MDSYLVYLIFGNMLYWIPFIFYLFYKNGTSIWNSKGTTDYYLYVEYNSSDNLYYPN